MVLLSCIILRKVFLDDLPTKKYGNEFRIDWNKVNGYILNFRYDDIVGEIKIVNASSKNKNIDIEYNQIPSKIDKSSLIHCKIGRVLGKMNNRGIVLGLSDITTTDPWMIPYFQGGRNEAKQYSSGSSKQIYPVCPACGRVRKKSIRINDINKMKGIGCICNDSYSYPKKFMYALLMQTHIDFEMEYDPDWAFGRLYDFYIPSLNIIIETDGGFHFSDNRLSGMSVEEIQNIDKEKDLNALNNNLEVIRIDCRISDFDYIIKNIKCSKLNRYFNLETINYTECDMFALKNFRKIICDYYLKNPQLVPQQIADNLSISRHMVTESLKIGTRLGWCEYNPKKNMKLGQARGSQKNIEKAQNVYVFDLNGNYLIEFQSAGQTAKKLSLEYNKVFNRSRIRKVIINKTYQYNGLLFFTNLQDGFDISKNIKYRRMKQNVNQYDLFGKFIKKYDYPTQAENETGIAHNLICKCCLRKCKSAGGFIWRYSNDCEDMTSGEYTYINKSGKHKCRCIVQYDKELNYIAEYNSITDAVKALELDNNSSAISAISACCRGIRKTAYDYIWKYADALE